MFAIEENPYGSAEDQTRPVHPGEILREDFMAPLGLSINALARALRVPPNTSPAS